MIIILSVNQQINASSLGRDLNSTVLQSVLWSVPVSRKNCKNADTCVSNST